LTPVFLLDTHVVLRWIGEPRRLSREQRRLMEKAIARLEPIAISGPTLLEIAALQESGRLKVDMRDIFSTLETNPVFQILPITFEIAIETTFLRALRDPIDRVIVATSRVHRLPLLTSDQSIVESSLTAIVA